MQTLALCMIVKDEESYLKECLECARPFVDEIVIVDTGSADRTKEIAKEFNAKIFDYKWNDNFSDARNFSLSKAKSDWILVIDADERISSDGFKRIKELVLKKDYDAFTLQQVNYTNERTEFGFRELKDKKPEYHGFIGYSLTNIIRLFRSNRKIRFMNPVHESVDSSVKDNELKLAMTDIKVHHYQEEKGNVNEKQLNYLRIYEANLASAPNKAKAHRDLGILYSTLKKDDEKAVFHFKESLKYNSNTIKTYVGLGFSLLNLRKFLEARDVFLDGIEISPNEPSLYIGMAKVNIHENNLMDAISNFRKALALGYADRDSISKVIAKLEYDLEHPQYR